MNASAPKEAMNEAAIIEVAVAVVRTTSLAHRTGSRLGTPGPTVKLRSATANMSPYFFVKPLASVNGLQLRYVRVTGPGGAAQVTGPSATTI